MTTAGLWLAQWFVVIFWVLAAVAIILGVVISADEYLTEKFYGSDSKGDNDGKKA